MRLPIDTSLLTFMGASEPEPATEWDSGRPKVDRNGEAVFAVQVLFMGDDEAEVLPVKVAGKPKGVGRGVPLKLTGLTANPWVMGDRKGVSYFASTMEPVVAPAPAKAAS